MMSLAEYNEKKSFDKTPRPTGEKPTDSKPRFVVQKLTQSHKQMCKHDPKMEGVFDKQYYLIELKKRI